MRYEINKLERRIRFRHCEDGPEFPKYTLCFIEQRSLDEGAKRWHEVDSGMAECSLRDTFVKETGRVISLRRAIRNLTDEEKALVMKTYFERPRG